MRKSEQESNLDLDYIMELDDSDEQCEILPEPLYFMNNNNLIYFGFYEKSSNIFYKVEESYTKKFIINRNLKRLEIKYNSKYHTHSRILFYNLNDNIPYLIKNNKNDNKQTKEDIILHFPFSPIHRKRRDNYNETSDYLLENYNLDNNLLCFDCPYKNIYIPNCSKENLSQIYHQLFSNEKNEILADNQIKILDFDIYKAKIKELKEKINLESKKDFNDIYTTYANISETLEKYNYETILSIYNNYKNEFKIEKNLQEKKTDKNKNEIYVMKRVVVSPYFIKIKKENLHPSSRFLRLYYKNNNFIKIEFQDERNSQLFSHFGSNLMKTDNVGFSKLYTKVFNEGFNLCGKKYLFFFSPTNCMKSNCIWLLEENEYKNKLSFYYKSLGIYSALSDESISFSKAISRVGQNFTSTFAFYHKNKNIHFSCEIIDDYKSPNGEIYNDGCGMISVDLMKDICNELNKKAFSSAVQIRYKGAKGILVINPKLEGKKIILTKSMIKYNVNNSENLEICRFAKYSTGFLNLQIIILLIINGVNKNKILRFAKKEMYNYRNYKIINTNINKKGSEKLLVECKEINKIINLIQHQDNNLIKEKEYLSKIARSTYIYNRLSSISKKYRFHLKNSCFAFGVFDFFGILKENEIFIQIHKEKRNKKIIAGDVLLTKNPCLSLYDIQKVKAINNDIIKEYYSEFYENVVIFPSKGEIPLTSKISGSDLDGDIYWVCWEQSFVQEFKKRDYSYKLTILKNEEELKEEFGLNEQGEKIKKTWTKIETINFNKTNEVINSNLKNDIINAIKNNENLDSVNNKIKNLCLKYYIFYQKNYKLPEVSRNHLGLINNLFINDAYKNGSLNDEIEKHAFYHSIEVDFQKTGETSFFSAKHSVPFFLMKKEQYKLSNNIIKIKEIYDLFKKQNKYESNFENKMSIEELEDDSSALSTQSNESNIVERNDKFYEFFISKGKYQEIDINRKYLKLYDKKKMIADKKNISFISQLYELISFYPAMQESFLSSIYLMTEDFFYENKLNEMTFAFSNNCILNKNRFYEIVKKIKDISLKYENDIKYIMKDNCITIELELIYFNEFIEPKKEVFKHDVEDYRKNLYESVNLLKKNSLNKIMQLKDDYLLDYEDIKNILYIILFWAPKEDICIISEEGTKNKINLNDIFLKDKKMFKSVKYFIEDLVTKQTAYEMNNFFYDNIKCLSLYFLYCHYIDNIKLSKK